MTAQQPHKDQTNFPLVPRRWWQWIIVYPAIISVVASVIAQLIPIIKLASTAGIINTSPSEASKIIERRRQFLEHLNCNTHVTFIPLKDNSLIEIGLQYCPLDHALLVGIQTPPGSKPIYHWIEESEYEQIASTKIHWQLSDLFMNPAVAVNKDQVGDIFNTSNQKLLAQKNEKVICQKQINNNLILRRVRRTSGACIDIIVDINTGLVVNEKPATCDASCR